MIDTQEKIASSMKPVKFVFIVCKNITFAPRKVSRKIKRVQ